MTKQFSDYLQSLGKSPNTVKSYCRDVSLYFKWCEGSFGELPARLYRANIQEYISYMHNIAYYCSKTVNRHLTSLRSLNDWLIKSSRQTETAVLPNDFMKIQWQYASPCTVTKKMWRHSVSACWRAAVNGITLKTVTDVPSIPELHKYGRLILLENFNLAELTEDVRDNVVRSIRHCCDLPLVLSDKEKAFLQEPFVGYSDLTGYAPFAEVFELLEDSPSLMEIARLLQEKNVEENLMLADYRIFAESLTEYTSSLSSIIGILEQLPLGMFLEYWRANGCLIHELQTMKRLLEADPNRDWSILLGSPSSYTNTLYGMKFKNLDWTALGRMLEGVIIYAISHNKKHFIRLVDENFDLFLDPPDNSVLFWKELYEEHFNINELTKKTLERLVDMPTYRLLVFRQICKEELLMGLNDNEILALAAALGEKTIHNWRQEDFGHIRFLSLRDTVQLLLHREELQHLISAALIRK